MASFGLKARFAGTYDEALARVTESLKSEGFGVLTEIDVKETLKKKLGVDFRPYKILGACNPPLAHRALSAEVEIGLMLPCNVIVYQDDEGRVNVSAVDPMQTVAAQEGEALAAVAREVREKLARVMSLVGAPRAAV